MLISAGAREVPAFFMRIKRNCFDIAGKSMSFWLRMNVLKLKSCLFDVNWQLKPSSLSEGLLCA